VALWCGRVVVVKRAPNRPQSADTGVLQDIVVTAERLKLDRYRNHRER